MNNWIYTAFRKPTETDGGENGLVFVRFHNELVGVSHWEWVSINDMFVAWMPIPKYEPLPQVPEGYELLTDYNAEPNERALWYSYRYNNWERSEAITYSKGIIYCVPSKPEWVPAIVTAEVLTPGTWVCIDVDGVYWWSAHRPDWEGFWMGGMFLLSVAEHPQITGEQAIWQIK